MLVHFITEFGVIADWVKVPRFRVLPSVMADGCNAEGGAIRAGPNHIRLAELFQNHVSRNRQNICVKVDIFKIF